MICVSSFHFGLIARHLDIVRYFIFALVYCDTLGQSLKQEGVYVTSLSCVHVRCDSFFKGTCVQVIQFII
jgi:hypothetical protein